MIRLPENPFKVIELNENDQFVENALRGRKHFELCWCGSGKKYKKCHRVRGDEEPFPLGKLLHLQHEVFWRKRGCMHPLASPKTCKGDVIDSHTIQRRGPLERIVDASGHVMHFEKKLDSADLKASPIGWRRASVFPGYCAFHDSSLFSSIEKNGFHGEHHLCVLHAFRNACNEYYRKKALIESLEYMRNYIDRGFDIDRQIELQFSYIKNIEGQKKSLNEMAVFMGKLKDAIVQEKYDEFESKCYFFEGLLNVVSSSVFQCEFDFIGNELVDMWDLDLDAQMLSHTVVNNDNGGAIVFVWLKDEKTPASVVSSFNDLASDEKGDIFIQYCFLNCENTYFSKQWWEQLSKAQQGVIERYANTLYYEGGAFAANENRLVDWAMV